MRKRVRQPTQPILVKVIEDDVISYDKLELLLSNIHTNDKGCWVRGEDSLSYTRINVDKRERQSHRVSYDVFNKDKIKSDRIACHKCDVPACINPDHIYQGSAGDNFYDMAASSVYKLGKVRTDTKQQVKMKVRLNKMRSIQQTTKADKAEIDSAIELADRLSKLCS